MVVEFKTLSSFLPTICNGILCKTGKDLATALDVSYTVLHKRFLQHKNDARKGSNTKLHKAMREHGFDNFRIKFAKSVNNLYTLGNLEAKYIKYFDTINNGYNTSIGKSGLSGGRRKFKGSYI